ncbi:PREDICTED: FK506-binding protein 5 [Papilio polytes]|uniref:FK506-binding protein 5 n=1 Tax=Papilio polytes TaxID=76194 RepID=UPI0006765717|nr:PREDICTED: FK506-binding protein 5 [Papilio polytes]
MTATASSSQEQAVVLNLGAMIDLAIGTPEVGVVDFGMLQIVLHCLAQEIRMGEKHIELRGDSDMLPVGRDYVRTVYITEFAVDTAGNKTQEIDPHAAPSPQGPKPESIFLVERMKKSEVGDRSKKVEQAQVVAPSLSRKVKPEEPPKPPAQEPPPPEPAQPKPAPPEPAPPAPAPQVPAPPEPPAPVRSKPASTERLSLVTLSKFNVLENTVEDLKNRVYGSMPKNEEILEEVRSQTNLKAITDMWTSLNVSSRLEATEAGIAKLSSLRAMIQQVKTDLDNMAKEFVEAMADLRPEHPVTMPPSLPVLPPAPIEVEPPPVVQDMGIPLADLLNKVCTVEAKLKECCDSVKKQEGIISDHINSFQDQIEHLSRQVAGMQDMAGSKGPVENMPDLQGLMKLYQTVQDMKEELKLVHETALHLASEKEDRQDRINAIIEQIEVLKTIKLDRDDMTEAMAEKADVRLLARKVSHDQFELACDDLSRGLDHALGKLNMQEALWQQALDDIQREIEMKLDKMELSPVKEFFNTKLKQLQDNLKQIASLRRSVEAAGAKKKLMRDLNCISCDAKVVMPMEGESSIPMSRPLPANLSMKPYLSYELDAIRKAQASNLQQRNLHDWEQIDKQAHTPKASQKVRSDVDKHTCNRYCGGSHTTTTAAQRVARVGHFVKQWGPDVLPLSSTVGPGDDGRMYKMSGPESAAGGTADSTCTPKIAKKGDAKVPEKRPVFISGECRCLEEGGGTNK